jgi:hypothetical protein
MHSLNNGNTAYASMDPPGTATFLLDLLKANFDRHYNGNRAPFGVYLHGAWLLGDTARVQVLVDFLAYVASKSNVFFATPRRIVNWMKNPVPASQVAATPDFQCPAAVPTASETCDGLDNDKNGVIDDNLLRSCGFTTVRACPLARAACG